MTFGAAVPVQPFQRVNKDALGSRLKLGVLGPSTNTSVQPDYDDLRPYGVTNHYSRIVVDNAQAISNETFMGGVQAIGAGTIEAVRSVMTCQPDYLVMGMSAVTFFGGAEGAAKWKADVEAEAGVRISTGAESIVAALKAYGNIRKVAFVSPYYPVANAEVARFLADFGYETVRDIPLQCPSWIAIAEQTPETVRDAFRQLDGDDVEALIQVGTNLSAMRVAAAGELWLGKPVIAINTATYWHALRSCGIHDKVPGFGKLMEVF